MLSPAPGQGPRDAMSISRVSNPSSRAASREGASVATVDPVLARYLSIKRDLDRAKDLRHASPAASAAYKVPAQPTSRTHVEDARSLLASPVPAMSSKTSSPARTIDLSDRLSARLEARQQRQAAAIQRAPFESIDLSVSSSRMPQAREVTNEREVMQLAAAVADSELARSRAEDQLRFKEEEVVDLKKRLAVMTSPKVEMSGSAFQLTAPPTQLQLQGRLEALERMVAERDEALDRESQRLLAFEKKAHEATRQLETLQLQLLAKERATGELGIAPHNDWREMERLRDSLEEAHRQLREERRKCLEAESHREDKVVELERAQLNHKDQLREYQRRIQELEQKCSSDADAEAHRSAELEKLLSVIASRDSELEQAKSQLRDAMTKVENLKVLSAQESIVNDELKYEVDRFKKMSQELREELTSQEQLRRQSEAHAVELQKELDSKLSLQSQVHSLQLQVGTLTLQLSGSEATLEETKRRWSEAREEADAIPHLQDQIAQLKAALQGRQLTIEKCAVTEKDLQSEVERLKGVVKDTEDREERLIEELGNAHERLAREERAVMDKQATINQLGEVMSTYDRLRNAVDEKTGYILQQQETIEALQRQNAELDADVETLLSVKRQVDELAVERQRLLDVLATSEAEISELHREASAHQHKMKDKDCTIADLKDLIAALESDSRKYSAAAADRGQLEGRVRNLSAELQQRCDELSRERQQREELSIRMGSREERISELTTRIQQLESQLTQLHRELAQSQVEQGRLSVMAETHAREKQRLQNEVDGKSALMEQVSEELTSCKRLLNETKLELQVVQARERMEAERHLNTTQQHTHLQDEIERLRTQSRRYEEDAAKREELVATLRISSDREKTTSERLAECQEALRRRDVELKQTQAELAALRETCRDLQAQVAVASKLEQRLVEAKATADKRTTALEQLERDDAAKQTVLLERERELARHKERLQILMGELDSERSRKRSLEERVRELEAECQRASVLDGQVAGLNLVIQQRSKDLEAERNANSELRAKIRQVSSERSAAITGRSASTQLHSESDAKLLATKEEQLCQARDELRRAQMRIETLQDELKQSESRREELRNEVRKLADAKERQESQWQLRFSEQERSLQVTRAELANLAAADSSGSAANRLRVELVAAHRRIEVLEQEQVDAHRQRDVSQRLASRERSSSDLNRARDALRQVDEERARVQGQLDERTLELEIATENTSLMQSRLRDERLSQDGSNVALRSRTSDIATPAPAVVQWDVATAEQTILQWRERRQRQMENELAAQAAYETQVRPKLVAAGQQSVAPL